MSGNYMSKTSDDSDFSLTAGVTISQNSPRERYFTNEVFESKVHKRIYQRPKSN